MNLSFSLYLRGVLIKWGTAKPDPQAARSAGPSGILSGLHPDLQRPPTHPSPSFGGPGSAALLRSMSAEDGFNKGEMCTGSVLGTGSAVPSAGSAIKFRFIAGFLGGRRPLEWRKRRGNRGKTRTADSDASQICLMWLAQRQSMLSLLSILIGQTQKARFDWCRGQIGIWLRYWRYKYCFCRNCMWFLFHLNQYPKGARITISVNVRSTNLILHLCNMHLMFKDKSIYWSFQLLL